MPIVKDPISKGFADGILFSWYSGNDNEYKARLDIHQKDNPLYEKVKKFPLCLNELPLISEEDNDQSIWKIITVTSFSQYHEDMIRIVVIVKILNNFQFCEAVNKYKLLNG